MSQDSLACLPDRFNKLHSRIFKMSRLTRRFTGGFSLPAAVPGIFYGNSSSQSSGISSSEFQLSSHMDYSMDLCNIIQPYKTIIINATRGVQLVLRTSECSWPLVPCNFSIPSAFDRTRGHHRMSWSINQATCRRTHAACKVMHGSRGGGP